MRHPFTPAVVAILGSLSLWNCGGDGGPSAESPTSPSQTAATVTVAIVASAGNSAFQPNPVRAGSGDTVIFRNNDGTLHHLVMDDGSADLGDIAPGATSRGFTLRSVNATNFHCTLHSSMVGSINGASAPEPPACLDPYGYGC